VQVHPCERTGSPVGLYVHPCEHTRRLVTASGIVGVSLTGPVNAQGAQWVVLFLELDQESSGIEFVYVCVCEGGVGRLGCGFVLLYSIFYILYSIFYILYILISVSSVEINFLR